MTAPGDPDEAVKGGGCVASRTGADLSSGGPGSTAPDGTRKVATRRPNAPDDTDPTARPGDPSGRVPSPGLSTRPRACVGGRNHRGLTKA